MRDDRLDHSTHILMTGFPGYGDPVTALRGMSSPVGLTTFAG